MSAFWAAIASGALRAIVAADVLARAAQRLAQNALVLLRVWRETHHTRWGWRRRLAKLSAHDSEDFTGKGIPRHDRRVFLDHLTDLLWEVRVQERGGPQ